MTVVTPRRPTVPTPPAQPFRVVASGQTTTAPTLEAALEVAEQKASVPGVGWVLVEQWFPEGWALVESIR